MAKQTIYDMLAQVCRKCPNRQYCKNLVGVHNHGLSGIEHLRMVLYIQDRAKSFAWESRVRKERD